MREPRHADCRLRAVGGPSHVVPTRQVEEPEFRTHVVGPCQGQAGAVVCWIGWYEGRAMGLRKGEWVQSQVGEEVLMEAVEGC